MEREELPPPQKVVTIKIEDYCPLPGVRFDDMWAIGMSGRVEKNKIWMDLDRDGLPNYRDSDPVLQTNLRYPDTNQDGYSDLLVYLGGFTADAQKALKICSDPTQDTDQDDLTDCEEDNLLHTDPKRWDSDGDGVSDGLEIRNGLHPKDPNDVLQDPDSDGLASILEVKLNTPPFETNSDAISALAYKYETEQVLNASKAVCFHFTVSNIPVLDVSNGNLVRLFFFERDRDGVSAVNSFSVVFPAAQADKTVLKYSYDSQEEQ